MKSPEDQVKELQDQVIELQQKCIEAGAAFINVMEKAKRLYSNLGRIPEKRTNLRARPIPPPRILSMIEVQRKLGQQVAEDAIKAGWLKHRCEKPTPSRATPKRLFALEDVEAVEDRILCGEYPTEGGAA